MSTALILLSEFQKTEMELWRPVAGFPGYEASSLGRVRSFFNRGGRGKGYRLEPGLPPTTMKLSPNWAGYLRITLRVGNVYRYLSVHRLVAQTFISNPDGLPEVNHLSGVKADCRVRNLERASMSRNKLHATRAGMAGGEKHGMARLSEEDVREIRRRSSAGDSNPVIAQDFRMTAENISMVVKRRTWKYVI